MADKIKKAGLRYNWSWQVHVDHAAINVTLPQRIFITNYVKIGISTDFHINTLAVFTNLF